MPEPHQPINAFSGTRHPTNYDAAGNMASNLQREKKRLTTPTSLQALEILEGMFYILRPTHLFCVLRRAIPQYMIRPGAPVQFTT